VKTSLGLELGQFRSAVRYDASIYGLEDHSHELGRVRVAIDRLFNLGLWCILPRGSTPPPTALHYMFCCWQVSSTKQVNESLESHIQTVKWCRTSRRRSAAGARRSRGIEAEAVAIIFVVQLLSKLSKLSFWVL